MKAKRVLVIISFIIVMVALVTAIVTDIVLFKDALWTIFTAIIVSAALLVFLNILMVVSIMMVFGVIILQQNGYWPLALAKDTFYEILNEIVITPEQIQTFQTIRIVLLVVCISTFVLAIIAKGKVDGKKPPLRGMSTVTLIFSILGILIAIGFIGITAAIK